MIMRDVNEENRSLSELEARTLDELTAECLELIETNQFDAINELLDRYPQWRAELHGLITDVCDVKLNLLQTKGGVRGPAESTVRSTTRLPGIPRESFGRYEIIKPLGSGGMGEVVLARDRELANRKVALKFPSLSRDDAPSVVKRFRFEANTLAQLRHENVCRIYDFGEIDGQLFIAMEFVEGRPLSEVIASGKRLSDQQARSLLRQLAKALSAIHQSRTTVQNDVDELNQSKGLLHRDLKPSNVIIDDSGKATLVDFGLAFAFDQTNERLTRDGFVGTPAYMSPEQCSRGEELSFASDLYSLGVLVYEAVSGRLPYPGDQVRKKLTEKPTSIRQHCPKLNGNLSDIIDRLIQPDPQERFATADELLATLDDTVPVSPKNAFWNSVPWKPSLLTLMAGLFFLATVWLFIRVQSGMLRIAVDDDAIGIKIDGERVELTDERVSGHRLASGSHSLSVEVSGTPVPISAAATISGASSGTQPARLKLTFDGVELTTDEIIIRRGNRHALVAKLKPFEASPKSLSIAPPSSTPSALGQLDAGQISADDLLQAGLTPEATPPGLVGVFGDASWTNWSNTACFSLAFSPGSDAIATSSLDGQLVIRGLRDGRVKQIVAADWSGLTAVAWHPIEESTIFVGDALGQVYQVDLNDGDEHRLPLDDPDGVPIDQLTISKDGHWLVTAGANIAQVFSLRAREKTRELRHPGIRAVAIEAQGDRIATAGGDNRLRIWERATGELLHTFSGMHRELFNAVTFAPDRQSLMLGLCNPGPTHRGLTRKVEIGADQWSQVLDSPGSFTWGIDFSSDGRWFAEVRDTGQVHVWDTETWSLKHSFETIGTGQRIESGKRSMAFSPDSRCLATTGDTNTVDVWDSLSGNHRAGPGFGRLEQAILHPSGTCVFAVSSKGNVGMWKIGNGESRMISPADEPLRAIAFRPDASLFATAGDDGTVCFWDSSTGEQAEIARIRLIEKQRSIPITDLAFHPSEPFLAVAARDGVFRLWNWRTGVIRVERHEASSSSGSARAKNSRSELRSVDFDPHGNRYCVAENVHEHRKASFGLLKIYRMSDHSLIAQTRFPDAIRHSRYSPSGKRITVVSSQAIELDELYPWENSRHSLTVLDPSGKRLLEYSMPVRDANFNSSESEIAAACYDGKVRVVDLQTGEIEETAVGPRFGRVSAVHFGPHDRHLVVANANGSIVVIRRNPKSKNFPISRDR
jgi:serine/threonine protein kinase/WD40 repeat protein